MTVEKVWERINSDEGAWLLNECGLYTKVWSEGGSVVVRAYCENGGGFTPWIYRRKAEAVLIREKDGFIYFDLESDMVDMIGETVTEKDRLADREFLAGVRNAIPVSSDLASHTGMSVTTTAEENKELSAFLAELNE